MRSGNVGKTVYYTDPLEANPTDGMESLRDLVNDMKAGKVAVLLILERKSRYTTRLSISISARPC